MSTLELTKSKGRFRLRQNVEYTLRDKFGNTKRVFSTNTLGTWFLKLFRKFNSNPIGEDGQVKAGVLNHLAAYGLRIPFITGVWSDSLIISNLVVNAGLAGVASRINGAGAEAAFTYIAIGTGAVAAAATDTTLGAEITTGGAARAAATASRVTTDVTNDTAQDILTYSLTASFAVTESGVFNAASAGTMLARQVFTAVNVVNGDSLQITWKFDVD